ncbi:VOC family protein [Kineosporia sp. NBRC 101731]|uniref:VOC family protein n=1 Tax=Kineosporia sp. NBRC 101731 TaxID=3032199 RepID=UPI0024A40AA3|nr:VOC family protein [Kineosporia sp. NBRC 101731]GLY30398.1 hypothetical protein Kisp02_37630 [Kineosporia sp. NBRC 101731]
MGISHITLISIPVTDQDKALSFYESLGFSVTNDHIMTEEEMPPEPDLRWLQLGTTTGDTTVVLANWTVGGLEPGVMHMSVAADDVKALHKSLALKNFDPSPIFDAPFGSFFNVNDPDGNGVMVVEEKK